MRQVYDWLNRYRIPIFVGLYAVFAIYASYATQALTAIPATRWMNVFNFSDFETWEDVWQYFRDLRTGVPPALSFLEILSFKWGNHQDWVFGGFYRKAMIVMLILPVFFTRRKLRDLFICYVLAWIFLESILIIHRPNAQLYDVVLPAFCLMSFWLFRASLKKRDRYAWLSGLLAVLAGFFLSMAELSRPFMLLFLPFCLIFVGYHYWAVCRRRFLWFLIPLLLCSGGWHLKLLIYNQGQVIWSNHGGFNLANAWPGLVDWEAIRPLAQAEAPPLQDNPWTWRNINTQVHYENSKLRQQAVWQGILAQPGKALARLGERIVIFTRPRTDMYEYNPEDWVLDFYRPIVHGLYWVLALLLIGALIRFIRSWRYIFRWECFWIGFTSFLSLMPILGENGEEARFMITVLPFLILIATIGADWAEKGLDRLLAYYHHRKAHASK